MSEELLSSKLTEAIDSLFVEVPEVPDYILNNLSHTLRQYQLEAVSRLIYTQESKAAEINYRHLMFHMATGSGKTMVLASSILYLFKEKGLQNFIFFVNSDAIIKKTIDNLTNESSPKYLFNKEGLVINGQKISIKVVEIFPMLPDQYTIYLKLTTIQKLHRDLEEPKENTLTYESFKELDVVLLADEAHHINALTKNKKKLTGKELEEKTWENTISKILKANIKNRLLEFTATIDLNNPSLFDKYRDKIVYQYDLKKFMNDGFSKNVVLLRADEADSNKMINAMLLSQYRKYIARDNDISLKPIILFKSNKIKISQESKQSFLDTLSNLNPESLERIIINNYELYKGGNNIWSKVFSYYLDADYSQLINDLRWDFNENTILDANHSEFVSEENALLLNSLEQFDNPIRAIFAVAKLNEGWDVLNLFDIVRISEGATNTSKTTDSEAQLIGRGARYYPFKYQNYKSYTRRFDLENSNLKAIETLHYHTINDNSYIKQLEKSLDAANIQVNTDTFTILKAKVKNSIKKLDFYKFGKIYINKLEPTNDEDYVSLKDYGLDNTKDFKYADTFVEHVLSSDKENLHSLSRKEEVLKPSKTLIQKSIQRNPFYRFSNIKNFVPSLSSMRNFINDSAFLGDIKINVSLPTTMTIDTLTAKEKLFIVEDFLKYIENGIKNNYMKERGTPIFEGISLNSLVDDYVIELSAIKGKTTEDVIKSKTMSNYDWFVYDKALGNSLELDMIEFINTYIEDLKKKYNEVYLIRNERKIKIVEINGIRGFMPDFLLYIKNSDFTYQVFIEPKGDHLVEKDKWKQDFLLSLSQREDIKVLAENEEVKLIGLKFYSDSNLLKEDFRNDLIEKLL
ncbi:type I restriction-modification system, R subunit [Macrococcoides caseolyticum]|uniref:DEAD/DEAH box helicase family protein n=1 Tax=Macrococcoides caseolyticum TaxID=69966 RepID=UPI001175C1DC|nr:DEAD/DEAH box helicase family protein [Macrococcus caseolyticus]VUC64736.1 type I restriction-modification system, R subunit [Macrococcus caseolyticus]